MFDGSRRNIFPSVKFSPNLFNYLTCMTVEQKESFFTRQRLRTSS